MIERILGSFRFRGRIYLPTNRIRMKGCREEIYVRTMVEEEGDISHAGWEGWLDARWVWKMMGGEGNGEA